MNINGIYKRMRARACPDFSPLRKIQTAIGTQKIKIKLLITRHKSNCLANVAITTQSNY